MELLMVLAVFGYIYYLHNYADLRTRAEKEEQNLKQGVDLFNDNRIEDAFDYFDKRIKSKPASAVAYLYRARCYKSRGDIKSAIHDLDTGISYDESVFGLHLEKGKIHFGNDQYDAALAALTKAVFYAGELNAESYYWRGLARQHLNQDIEAHNDFEKEAQILQNTKNNASGRQNMNPLIDRKFMANSLIVVATGVLLLLIIKDAESIHLPYLMAAFSAICIGFAEPVRGWLLAIMQCILIISGYFLFTDIPETTGKRELEYFSLYGSTVLIFTGSFLGAFVKKAINQN